MYQALYRKWRPQVFTDVYGQPHITKTLQNELKDDRISHAYLFTGSRGTGKTTCAKILSKAVNCLNLKDGNPCNECEICRGIDNGSILDVIEIDAASNNSVDDVRDLREEANFTPSQAKYRVYIIDEVHMLSTSAFNALLKTLEEPPAHVIFILATTEIHKLPSTILSRCQRFDFKRISPDYIVERLKYVSEKENISIDDDAARLIARIADGGMRDALSILDRCLAMGDIINESIVSDAAGIAGTSHLFEFSNYISSNDISACLNLISQLYNDACEIDSLCKELIVHFRNLMIVKTVSNCKNLIVCSADELQRLKERADKYKISKIINCIDILESTLSVIKTASNKKIHLESAVIKICSESISSQNNETEIDSSLINRIIVLENRINELASGINTRVDSTKKLEPTNTQLSSQFKEKPEATEIQTEQKILPDGFFVEWSEVLDNLMMKDPPLYSLVFNSSASIKEGKLVIKTENPTLYDFIRNDNHHKDLLKSIFDVTGYKLKIVINCVSDKKTDNSASNPLSSLKSKIENFNT